MKKCIFCTAGNTNALFFAGKRLADWGYTVLPELTDEVTHLLLPVPTPPELLPPSLPEGVMLLGGNLGKPVYPYADFLQDEFYLRENADITAQCALDIAQGKMPLQDASVLVIGWGRIGKCLAARLHKLRARVTVAARREETLAQLAARDIAAAPLPLVSAKGYDLIINTAPAPVLDASEADDNAVLMDLASKKGISGGRVLWARGLPNKMAPETSGALMAKTALRYALKKE